MLFVYTVHANFDFKFLNGGIFSFEKGSNGQNHSSSGSHRPAKKFSILAKYMTHLPPLSTIWKALIYNVVIGDSLVPAMGNRTSSAQVHELPQSHFVNKQGGTFFHEHTQNVLKQKIKLEAYFVKNSYIALLCKIMKYYLRWVGIKLIQLNKQMHNVCFDFTSHVDIV